MTEHTTTIEQWSAELAARLPAPETEWDASIQRQNVRGGNWRGGCSCGFVMTHVSREELAGWLADPTHGAAAFVS